MDGLTLDQLVVFIAASEEGSFSSAGRKLRRVQSAVSYAIKNLEDTLSVELFDRSERSPILTTSGKALLSDARAVIAQVDALRRRAASIAAEIEPGVSIVLDSVLSMSQLFPVLKKFERAYPDTDLVIHHETLGALQSLVEAGRCDIGFGHAIEPFSKALSRVEIAFVEMVMLVGKEHPLAELDEVARLEALQAHTQIVLTDRSKVTEGRDHGVYSPKTWRVADMRTKLSLIEAGFGFGSVPSHMALDSLTTGSLAVLHIEGREEGRFRLPISAITQRRTLQGPARRWLAAHITEAICDMPNCEKLG